AEQNVLDVHGVPVTLDTLTPMLAAPMLSQRKAARSVESSVIPVPVPAVTPVDTVTPLGAGCCGRGRGRCWRRAGVSRAVVSRACGFGGGAGGFWDKRGVAIEVRTANAAHGREHITAAVN